MKTITLKTTVHSDLHKCVKTLIVYEISFLSLMFWGTSALLFFGKKHLIFFLVVYIYVSVFGCELVGAGACGSQRWCIFRGWDSGWL